MKRIILGLESFRTLIQQGVYIEEGVALDLETIKANGKFEKLINGGEITQGGGVYILSDLGAPIIQAIIDGKF